MEISRRIHFKEKEQDLVQLAFLKVKTKKERLSPLPSCNKLYITRTVFKSLNGQRFGKMCLEVVVIVVVAAQANQSISSNYYLAESY